MNENPLPASDPGDPPSPESPSFLVGIGASAGGLEALRSFFSSMPNDTGMAFVVIQHLAPDYKSLMVELLSRCTAMPVRRIEHGMKIGPDQIYLIPPRFNVSVDDGKLFLSPQPEGLNLPIDLFFHSLARSAGERAVAIVLSGTGSDGARGIRAIKEAGGVVLVQEEASAKFAGMPASAIATGLADMVLPVEQMPGELVNFARHPFVRSQPGKRLLADSKPDFERIAQRLKEATGIDFSFYKHTTLTRRIERRMNLAQIRDVEDYLRYLSQSRVEAQALGKDLLISVTRFFRDREVFDRLKELLEPVFKQAAPQSSIRVWSAGCATGEEAYSLAMLCDIVREQHAPSVDFKVFATDVDEAALDLAGAGLYPLGVLADLPEGLLDRYFSRESSDEYRVVRSLRDHLIFARQDLMSDPPFTKMDLVSCRNILIYLQVPAQRRLLTLFHFALQPRGILLLGNSESLGELSRFFDVLDSRCRLFRKSTTSGVRLHDAISSLREISKSLADTQPAGTSRLKDRSSILERIQIHLLEHYAPATLVATPKLELLYTIGECGQYLQIPSGPADFNLSKLLPRALSLAVNSASAQALRDNRRVDYRAVQFTPPGSTSSEKLLVQVDPYQNEDETFLLISFRPDSIPVGVGEEVQDFDFDQQLSQRVNDLENELHAARLNLQSAIEQQETSNEELQASNEELLAANEELQSTNEELESVNEELYTVNSENQLKIQELTDLNSDIENFTSSTDIGTVFFDSEMGIRRFTPAFGTICGLVTTDVGRNATTFAHPVLRAIAEMGRGVVETGVLSERLISLNEVGEFLLRVQPYLSDHASHNGVVASLVNVSAVKDAQLEMEAILNTVDVGICVTDGQGRFVRVNAAYCRIYGYGESEIIGKSFCIVVPPPERAAAQRMHDDFIREGREIPAEWDVIRKDGSMMRVAVRASLLKHGDGHRFKVTVVSPVTPPAP